MAKKILLRRKPKVPPKTQRVRAVVVWQMADGMLKECGMMAARLTDKINAVHGLLGKLQVSGDSKGDLIGAAIEAEGGER